MSIFYEKNQEYSTGNSRYQILRTIINTDDNSKYLETFNQKEIPESPDDAYHIVSQSEVNRLDIISNKYYQSPTYWWAIALANGFIDPFIVNEGEMIRIPSLITLSDIENEILTRGGST